jgi:hypothetical protein
LHQLASIYVNTGKIEGAIALYQQSLEINESIGDVQARISHHDVQKWLISLPDKRSREGQKKQSVILHNQPKVQWGLGLSSFSQDL